MPKEEFKKEYPELFKRVPSDILGLFFSEKTPLQISEICLRNGVEDGEKISQIAYWIGRVLLGGLSPEKLPETLEKEVRIETEAAQKISGEINETLFSPVEETLSTFYKGKVPPTTKPPRVVSDEEAEPGTLTPFEKPEVMPSSSEVMPPSSEKPEKVFPPEESEIPPAPETPEVPTPSEEKPAPPSGKDVYREPTD